MEPDLTKRMFEYYDERADEYEASYNEVYTLADPSVPDPHAYKREAAFLAMLAGDFIRGCVIDIACGTAFLLPSYAPNCSSMTLFDQSSKMLAICRNKVHDLGIHRKCTLVRGDVFGHGFPLNVFDSAVVGFFLSHLTQDQEDMFFQTLRRMLKPGGRLLIADSIWSKERAKSMVKEGRQQRVLKDGRTFEIYKRYFDKNDFERMEGEYGLNLTVVHAGRVFIAVVGIWA